MANKMLGKVVAGAALGGASLLVFTPGIAFADGGPRGGGEAREGGIHTKSHVVKAGEKVTLVEICTEPQEEAFVWSKVTGQVKLHRAEDGGKGKHDEGEYGKGEHGKPGEGKPSEGKGEHGKPGEGKGEEKPGEGKGEGKPSEGKGEEKPGENKAGEHGKEGGKGGGVTADGPHGGANERDFERGRESERDQGSKHEGGKQQHRGSEGSDYGKDEGSDHGRSSYGEKSSYAEESSYGKGDRSDHGRSSYDEESSYGKGDRSGYGRGEHGKGEDEGSWEHKKDFVYYGEAEVARDAEPGRYEVHGPCGEGELIVLPRGHVEGGDGGSAGTDRGMATAGAGMLGAAALGGIVLMRRRRTDGSLA
jgi:hypothetical protein